MSVLRLGPRIHPDKKTTSRVYETRLGIDPHRVYAYLGRTLEVFGNCALALPPEALTGEMSPFDTGGLINHIAPISGYDDARKQAFLRAYTWPTADRSTLIQKYPTSQNGQFAEYLEGVKAPSAEGPHKIWQDREIAAIWSGANDSRAWTWEGRSSPTFDVKQLHRWTCSPAAYPAILEHGETYTKAVDAAWFQALISKYIHGGVSALVMNLRQEQAA